MTGWFELVGALTKGASASWLAWVEVALWRGTGALLVVTVVDCLLRRRLWPQVLAALWSAAFLLHVLPPRLVSPLGLFPIAGAGARSAVPGGSDAALGFPGGATSGVTTGVEAGFTAMTPGAASGIAWSWLLLIGWLGGVLLFARAARRRQHRDLGRIRRGRVEPSARLLRAYRRARRRFDRGRSGFLRWLPEPRLLLSETAEAPAAVGALRPEIVLPAWLVKDLDDGELEHVMVHELAHVRRGDLLLQALIGGLHLLFWFQPLLIWARRRAHACRELCCDATAASLLADDAGAYRTTLLRLALDYDGASAPEATGLFAGVIVDRVEWLESEHPASRPARLVAVGVLLASPAVLLPAAPPPDDDDPVVLARQQVEAAVEEGSSLRLRYAVMQLREATEPAPMEEPESPTRRDVDRDEREGGS